MINEHYFLIIVCLLAIGTIAIRGSFIALAGKMVISTRVRELFSYIPAAILPALIIPATFFHQGKVEYLYEKERFFIMIAAVIAAYLIRNTLFIISFGLGLLYLVTYG